MGQGENSTLRNLEQVELVRLIAVIDHRLEEDLDEVHAYSQEGCEVLLRRALQEVMRVKGLVP